MEEITDLIMVTGFILIGIQIAATVFLTVSILEFRMIPKKYTVFAVILLSATACGFIYAQQFKTAGIITRILSVIITACALTAAYYIKIAYRALKKATVADHKKGSRKSRKNNDVLAVYLSGVNSVGSLRDERLSEVNIILILNKKSHQVMLLNTSKDCYVETGGTEGIYDRLSHTALNGIGCSVSALENLYGINIDNYVKLNFTGFVKIIDALGGIDVYSHHKFRSYHGNYRFKTGINHMNGKQALSFAREKLAFESGDNERRQNQMAVIAAVIKKMASIELFKNYREIADLISVSMLTDMTVYEIGKLIEMQIAENPQWDIKQYSVGESVEERKEKTLSGVKNINLPDEMHVKKAISCIGQIINGK